MSNSHLVVTPDAQYDDGGVVERETAGNYLSFVIVRKGEVLPEEALQNAAGVLVWHEEFIDGAWLARVPECRIIVRAGVGFDNIDIEAAGARGIPVCNTPDYGTAEVADHAMAMLLCLERNLLGLNARLADDPSGGFSHKAMPLPRRLHGRRFGIVGLGRIGTATALRARAFGMQVAAYDPYMPDGHEISVGVQRVEDLGELAKWADVLSLHAPLTAETEFMIDAGMMAALGPDAILVNTARGPLVDLDALADALLENRLRAAAIDVFPQEPPSADMRLLAATKSGHSTVSERLILTPHSAWSSVESCVDARTKSVRIIRDFLVAGHLRNCVNLEFLRGGG